MKQNVGRINSTKKIFFDTSILCRIAWSQKSDSEGEMRSTWDFFLEQMDDLYPGFSEEDFSWITSSALYLEIIGLGPIREKTPKYSIYAKHSFKPLRKLTIKDEWKQFASPEDFVQEIKNRINKFVEDELNPFNLYRQTSRFLRKYSSHFYSIAFVADIKRWAKNIKKKPEYYAQFREAFFWDSVFRYPIINIDTIAKDDRLAAMQFWAGGMAIWYREYYGQYVKKNSLECPVLGLFAEIDRVGSFYNGITIQNEWVPVLRRWDDMVDADAIHFALIGKRMTLEINDPVIVVTGDKREDVERRLECLHKNLQEMSDKGLPIKEFPGTIVFFSLETMKITGNPLDVRDFINQLDGI